MGTSNFSLGFYLSFSLYSFCPTTFQCIFTLMVFYISLSTQIILHFFKLHETHMYQGFQASLFWLFLQEDNSQKIALWPHQRESFIFIKTNKGLIAKDTACNLSVTPTFIMNFHNAFVTVLS